MHQIPQKMIYIIHFLRRIENEFYVTNSTSGIHITTFNVQYHYKVLVVK